MDKWENDILVHIQTFRSGLGFYANPANYASEDAAVENAVQQDCGENAKKMVNDLRLLEEKIRSRHEES